MKPFLKRAALVTGLLFAAALCMGIVFIDSTNHYWRVGGASGAYVQLIVSNSFIPFSVNTNTGRIGINSSNANSVSIQINGLKPATNAAGNGASANVVGRIAASAGDGGDTFATTTASGGLGGGFIFTGGTGGQAPLAITNNTGGGGGALQMGGGNGGGATGVATNATIGGAGGSSAIVGGAGGIPSMASTQTVAGAGGAVALTGGASAAPSAGWSRKTSAGGAATITGGSSGNSTRTNSGDGGGVAITAGSSGNVTTSPGDPGTAGFVEILGGGGGTGATNANGGPVYIVGGTGAITGPIVLGVTSGGTARGSTGVGTNNPSAKLHVAGDIAMTASAQSVNLSVTATNNILQTNWLGTVNVAAASVIEAAFNLFSEVNQTNRMTGNQTITLTNGTSGYRQMGGVIPGEAAGGASRNAVFVAQTGQLIIDEDDPAAAPATSKTVAIPAGNVLEWNVNLKPFGFTNFLFFISKQAKF